MKKFEYRIIKTTEEGFFIPEVNADELLRHLNTMGLQGWELINAVETNNYNGGTNEILLFLKKEIVE